MNTNFDGYSTNKALMMFKTQSVRINNILVTSNKIHGGELVSFSPQYKSARKLKS